MLARRARSDRTLLFRPMNLRLADPARLDAVRSSGMVDTDREPAFDELTKAAAQVMRAPFALISIMDDSRSFWKSTYGLPASMRGEFVGDSFCQYVVEHQLDLLTADVRVHPLTCVNPTIEAKGVRAWAGTAIEFNGEILGTLCVIDSEVREWTVEDRRVLRALAAIASREIKLRASLRVAEAAVASAETASARTRSLLDTLRSSLLPPTLPTIPGLDLAAWFEAADDGDMLLGDFYDVFPLGAGRWGLVVGDVCGHGVEAAKLTSLVRYSLRSAAVHHRDPADVMAEVDAAIRADASDRGRFATVCYLQIDVGDSATVRWARAGHPRPILVSAAGSPRFCDGADGPPLGITAGQGSSSWSVGEFSIDAGESLVVYTDGLTDSRIDSTGEPLGEDRLVDMIHGFDAPCEAAGKLLEHLAHGLRFVAGQRRDDVAVMVVSSTSIPRSTPTSTSQATEQT